MVIGSEGLYLKRNNNKKLWLTSGLLWVPQPILDGTWERKVIPRMSRSSKWRQMAAGKFVLPKANWLMGCLAGLKETTTRIGQKKRKESATLPKSGFVHYWRWFTVWFSLCEILLADSVSLHSCRALRIDYPPWFTHPSPMVMKLAFWILFKLCNML